MLYASDTGNENHIKLLSEEQEFFSKIREDDCQGLENVLSSLKGHTIYELVQKRDANYTKYGESDPPSALEIAVRHNNQEMVELLLKYRAPASSKILDLCRTLAGKSSTFKVEILALIKRRHDQESAIFKNDALSIFTIALHKQ